MVRPYDPGEIEPKWVAAWEQEGLYAAGPPNDPRPKFYALDMFPYPSGDLHMGHAEAFALGDAIPRFMAMRGHNVLHPIGWDSFGLPAENAAIQRGIHPKEWTYRNIDIQASSFKRYGASFDWRTRLHTSDPDYYRWTQWLFLKFFERGLAYRKMAPANWCPKDQTVLANEQVVAGACERCGTPVVRKDLIQWFFKITDYAQSLLDDMELLEGWTDRVLTMQRNWIGRSEGAEVTFEIAETGEPITVFTTRPDTLWGVTFFVFAPEHPQVEELARIGGTSDQAAAMRDRLQATPLTSREQAESREGVPLGVQAVNPVNGEKVPCFVAPYVLMEYGTGAVMGVPGHDQRDFEFAREHGLEVRVVIQPDGEKLDGSSMTEAYEGEGVMVSSGPFDGTPTPGGIADVVSWLETDGKGNGAVSFRIRDWLISRQRYWGCPIPIIHCPEHGEVAVPEEDLPVELPDDVDFSPMGESPLAKHEGFVSASCPQCGKAARRETDTMDTFVDSSWYFFRYLSPRKDDGPFEPEAAAVWMPVNQYTGGIEHAILHLLYARFFTKVLNDMGMVPFREPFPNLLNQGQVILEGAAMSKSKGNIVEPMPLVDKWGADTIRLTMLFANKPEDDVDWATVSPEGVHDWLGRVWRSVHQAAGGEGPDAEELRHATHRTISRVTALYERHRFNVAVARLMELSNDIHRTLAAGGVAVEAARALVLMMAPMAPFIAEELWREVLGEEGSVHRAQWPTFDPELAREETVVLVVQVDGKVRDKIDVSPDVSEEEAERLARESENARRALGDRPVTRVITRPPKLVNMVTR
ncbi:MAG TPA: leucine--tRNA ligase [Actinomycetota bacterium]|nr:leucine--tRNA ligase [Actinomycetota bacterium]